MVISLGGSQVRRLSSQRWVVGIAAIAVLALLLSTNTNDETSIAWHVGMSIVIIGALMLWFFSGPFK